MPLPYSPPHLEVHQTFAPAPEPVVSSFAAWLVGPVAKLTRYSLENERSLGFSDEAFSSTNVVLHPWPNQTAGSLIDLPRTRVRLADAKILIFTDALGSGSTIAATSGRRNGVTSSALSFRTENSVARSDGFYDRDVRLGDVVRVSNGSSVLWSRVSGFGYDTVAAAIGDPINGTSNKATNAGSAPVITLISGSVGVNGPDLDIDVSDYNSLRAGLLSDTYTITVTTGSSGGDYTTARFSIQAASGDVKETMANVQPAASGSTVTVGNRFLKVGFTGTDPLVVGMAWTVAYTMAYTAPNTLFAGTFTGNKNRYYKIYVKAGGLFSDTNPQRLPIVEVTTVGKTDPMPKQTIQIVDNTTVYDFGSDGVTVRFKDATGLVKGDIFYVSATAETVGRCDTLVLEDDLPTALAEASDLELKLYIQRDVELPATQLLPSAATNWTSDQSGVTINPAIQASATGWTDGGEALFGPVEEADVHIEYREWLSDLSTTFGAIWDISQIDEIPGPLDEENPLKWGARTAVLNSESVTVYYTGVSNPADQSSWTSALSVGASRSEAYGVCPMSEDPEIIELCRGHVNSSSGPRRMMYRRLYVGVVDQPVTQLMPADSQATVIENPNGGPNEHTLVVLESGSFITAGVQPNDRLRISFRLNDLEEVEYDEYVVDRVLSGTSLLLQSGPPGDLSQPERIEIYHTNSHTERADRMGATVSYGDRRVIAVFVNENTSYASYYNAAAVAGACSAALPHESLTNSSVTGVGGGLAPLLDPETLDRLAAYGTWIISRDTETGATVHRDGLTTDRSSISTEADPINRNLDDICRGIKAVLRPMIGRANITSDSLGTMRILVLDYLTSKQTSVSTLLGPQIIEIEKLTVRQHLTNRKAVVVEMRLRLPRTMDIITATVEVSNL